MSIAQTRLGVPLPPVVKTLRMVVLLEMVRAAGMHMPGAMDQTGSIVGASAIGQSAVIAGRMGISDIVWGLLFLG